MTAAQIQTILTDAAALAPLAGPVGVAISGALTLIEQLTGVYQGIVADGRTVPMADEAALIAAAHDRYAQAETSYAQELAKAQAGE